MALKADVRAVISSQRPGRGYHVGCRAVPVLADLLYPRRWQINELVESLEEDAISPLALDDGTVTCAISSQKQGRVPLTLVVQDPGAYPRSPVLLLSDAALPCLDQLGEKLAAGCRLSRAIRLVGTMLGEWGWAQRTGSGQNRQASDAAGLAALLFGHLTWQRPAACVAHCMQAKTWTGWRRRVAARAAVTARAAATAMRRWRTLMRSTRTRKTRRCCGSGPGTSPGAGPCSGPDAVKAAGSIPLLQS